MINSSNPLIIMIRDDKEQQKYFCDGVANFYGGFFSHFPALIQTPETGYWNVCIDPCGYTDEQTTYSIEIFEEKYFSNVNQEG